MSIIIDASELGDVGDDLRRLAERVRDEVPGQMRRATLLVESAAKQRAPVNTGRLRASISSEVRGVGLKTVGVVGAAAKYAAYVELGTRPHWPPARPIRYWAMRKLRLRGRALEAAVRGIQRKIARHGTQAQEFLQGAFVEQRDAVIGVFVDWIRGLDF